jgi:hypothetical protein
MVALVDVFLLAVNIRVPHASHSLVAGVCG